MLDTILNHLRSDTPAALERFKQLLAIPSVSTDPSYKADVARAANWVNEALTDAGMKSQVLPTKGHPVVLAKSTHATPPGAKHVLFYGHYDVQPADPLDKWTTPAFEPVLRDGTIVARGASDDKGPVFAFIDALRAWKISGQTPPVQITVLIEGEEEMGSPSLAAFLEQHKADLAADFVLISDTGMWDKDTVAITYGLRGLAYFDVQLQGPSRDLHSGMYGGSIPNPALELVRVLGGLLDKNNRVTIPGFYDDVLPVTPDEKVRWSKLSFDEKEYYASVGIKQPYGEAGYSTLERKWARPSCDICGLFGGYGGPGAKTVLPSMAGAKVSFRLAPNQNHKKVGQQLESWLRSHDVHGCTWKITDLHGAEPVITPTDSPYIQAASRAVQHVTNRPCVLMREGATIPVVASFKTILGLDAVMVGFGLPDDRIHSPNEKWDVKCFELARLTHAAILQELGR